MSQKIISGGQTGADRAALDWALVMHAPLVGRSTLRTFLLVGMIR
ncbi:YpsA SLOG family protein [Nitrosospira lacus]